MQRDRIGELDGLRAIALLIVVIWHYFGAADGPQGWPWRLLHVGRFGVDLFFILSGYLITDILLRHRTAERYYSVFYGRRAFRIWPLYYLMCAAALIGWSLSLSPDLFDTRGVPGWLYLFGLQNFGMAKAQTDGAYFLAVTWSLAIEEQFYLLFPLLVRNIPPERLFAILLVPILICPIGRLIDSALPDAYGWYVLPQFRIDSLAIGALIAWWRLYRKPDAEVSRRVAGILKWSTMALPLLWLFGWKRWSVAVSHTQVEIFFGALLFVVLDHRGSPQLAILRSSVANFFARTSYAAYLIHPVVVYLLFAVLHQPRTVGSVAGISLTFTALVLTFGLCALSYRYFERPLLDFAHRRFVFN